MKIRLKKIITLLWMCGLIAVSIPGVASAADPFDDYVAVRKMIGLYIQSGKEAKSDIMKQTFHKDAIMYGTAGAEVTGGPIQGLFDYIDSTPKATALEAEIASIEIVESTAYVRVESRNWNGSRYSDMFLLLKDQNGWKIITKIYFDHK